MYFSYNYLHSMYKYQPMTISQKNIYFWLIIWLFSFVIGYFSHNDIITLISTVQSKEWGIIFSQKSQEVYSYIEKYYYGFHAKDKKKLEDSFLTAMATSLGDKHTNYFNVKDSSKFVEALAWDFQWIGAVIEEHKKGIQIMKVIEKSPAKKSKLEEWDVITHVNGESMVWVPVSEAVDKIRWPKGTQVVLTILRVKNQEVEKITVTRDIVIVPSVENKMLSGSVGYVGVSVFGENTSQDIAKAFSGLIASWATAIILDARNNGGGYLDSAVEILSLILKPDTVAVTTKWNNVKDNQIFFTKNYGFNIGNIPLVMLVNSMSASATEITAGALQDHERALIVWETSYGKWSVQTPFYLSDGSLLKITTAKWFTPKERGIDEKWIIPDIEIHFTDDDYKKKFDRQLEWALKIIQKEQKDKMSIKDWKEAVLKDTY